MEFVVNNNRIIINKICISGLGYIGLPTAALLANRGFNVIGVDTNETAVNVINQGKIHIVEPDLDTFVKAAVDSGRLKAQLLPDCADVFYLCVPTPFKKGNSDFDPDMSFVKTATLSIAPYIKPGNLIILESTSPVGSTEMIRDILLESGVDIRNNYIAYCPERVLPGRIMTELVQNDRIVGGIDMLSTEVIAAFYRSFVAGKVLETDCKTAEMVKLVENASRDVQIAFANELSMICDDLDINVWELIKLANHHPRVNILNPGTGVGGHCIAVDPWFIVSRNPEEAKIIRQAREVNNYKTEWVIDKIKKEVKKYNNPKIAFMGISFKPDIDDLRESPALRVVESFLNSNVDFVVCEPNLTEHKTFKLVSVQEALDTCNIIIFLVAHKQFFDLKSNDCMILDFCGITK